MADLAATFDRDTTARELLREYFTHVVNGIDLLYKGMERATITINIAIRAFVIFQSLQQFPHFESRVELYLWHRVVDGRKYFRDLKNWDIHIGSKQIPDYDQAILFTR
ncbi:hypothetical protein CHS0354_000170 [Potamilus streckersoni]|uniref:Uncharacterized protein n=1 Tax=Potamilus streckersoni TaxID=2493646 RepID=A0AAE0S7K9_9BIVA|nr:hypothetical protein CHS0354_000170 [Potamilus streckersoni]